MNPIKPGKFASAASSSVQLWPFVKNTTKVGHAIVCKLLLPFARRLLFEVEVKLCLLASTFVPPARFRGLRALRVFVPPFLKTGKRESSGRSDESFKKGGKS